MDHPKLAAELFQQGYNCAQAVYAAFCDITGLTTQQAVMQASAFGGGMGRLREVCGAVSGMFLVLSITDGYEDPAAREEKAALYKTVRTLADAFRAENGDILCRELLKSTPHTPNDAPPEARTKAYYAARPCTQYVASAAAILDEYLSKRQQTPDGKETAASTK